MSKTSCLLFLFLFFFGQLSVAGESAPSEASNLNLSDVSEIAAAQRISKAMEMLSSRVMACIDAQNGETTGCTCTTRSECQFKEEYNNFISIFCDSMESHPKWKGQNVFFQESKGSVGHTLATRNIYSHYGKECITRRSSRSLRLPWR